MRTGTRRDAILHSIGATARHGLQRTDADKRRAVEMLLKDEEWSRWSDREVSRLAGVGKTLVHKTRGRLQLGSCGDARLARRGDQVYEIWPAHRAPALVVTGATTTEVRGDAPDVAADWRRSLVSFSSDQIRLWKGVVAGRTDESVWAKAVGVGCESRESRIEVACGCDGGCACIFREVATGAADKSGEAR